MLCERRFARRFSDFVALADAGSGLQPFFDGLEAKHRLFREGSDIEAMLRSVFTARRRLDAAAAARIIGNDFSPADRRQQGAAHDFAAELRHFRDPVAHPLETRWAGDALRELAGEGGRVEHGAARAWMYQRIAGEGIYRDRHWWVDLTLAMAYVDYLRAMTGGVLGSDFTRAMTPAEQLRKLLGITEPAHADS